MFSSSSEPKCKLVSVLLRSESFFCRDGKTLFVLFSLFLAMYVCNDDGVSLYEYLFALCTCTVRVKYDSFNLNVFAIKEFLHKLKIDIHVLDKI